MNGDGKDEKLKYGSRKTTVNVAPISDFSKSSRQKVSQSKVGNDGVLKISDSLGVSKDLKPRTFT